MFFSFKAVKKALDDKDRARKAALAAGVIDTTKRLLAANKNLPYLVYQVTNIPYIVFVRRNLRRNQITCDLRH